MLPNQDTGWLGREPTVAEIEVVEWLRRHRRATAILHVGTGNCLLSREFGPAVVQGLSRDGGEAEFAKTLGLEVITCNKYDVLSYSDRLSSPFDAVVDVNIRSYACCDEHFLDYMELMKRSLSDNGVLVTSKLGLDYKVPTTTAELARLCDGWQVKADGNVVILTPRRKRRGWKGILQTLGFR